MITDDVTDFQVEQMVSRSAGEILRAKREEKGLSLKEAAQRLRMTPEVLSALESMQTRNVSPSIVRLQAATYAGFLGLAPNEIADAFAAKKAVLEAENLPEAKMEAQVSLVQRFAVPATIAAGILVVGAVTMMGLASSGPETTELPVYRQVATSAPAVEAQAVVTSLAARQEFSIRAIESSWIEARGSDGTVFRNRVMDAGEVYYPRIGAGWTVTLNNAGAFEWWLGDQRIGAVGAYGESMYSVSVDTAKADGETALSTALAATGEDGAAGR
ncbi:MAG: RodZ domain-containing protein [Pseudomonadota bacterium]